MYQSSDSQFFRPTTGADAFDESRFVMTFLTILGVMEILCSFRLVLEGKTGKGIAESSRLELLEKFLANNFAISDYSIPGPLNREGIADLPFNRVPRFISSARIGQPVLMMDIKVSKDKHISRWVDRENLVYVR